MAFVLIQHLDPQHESALVQLLTRVSALPVREATDNLRVQANCVYVIAPNTNLSIEQGALKVRPRPQTRAAHRSIDFFFESLAQDQREQAIGVVLSGTATDGTLGLEAIKAEGGITFAQDESARYDSMPRSAVAAGSVDFELSPRSIAQELVRIAKHPYVVSPRESIREEPEADRAAATAHEDDATPLPSGGRGSPRTDGRRARAEARAAGAQPEAEGFKKILLLLRNHSGVDFALYKSSTIQRRVTRRMVLNQHERLDGYAAFLKGNAKELDALYSDVLISVTNFFRNPEAFDVLANTVFPTLLKRRSAEPLRVWVLGCSTGQEAYSIAMTFVEAAEKSPRGVKLQVFATDLNDALLEKARRGFYAKSLAADISQERLRRFFIEEEGGYQVVKSLRQMVVFARQNLISDPPFSRVDLISCRNLLIYLDASLQRKAFPTFHYALKPGGFLFLGGSESVGSFSHLFEPIDRKHKIFVKKVGATPGLHLPVKQAHRESSPSHKRQSPALASMPKTAAADFGGELGMQREADRITVTQFAPPGVLINADLQIVQFRGPTSAYLESPAGKATFDVLKMARAGLMIPLRAAINSAKTDNKAVRTENVKVGRGREARSVDVQVIPLKNSQERSFLILFEEVGKATRGGAGVRDAADRPQRTPRSTRKTQEAPRIDELETELAETRDYLQSLQEQHEAANEELQAANEETQSANEELQSINEELETSKEELESSNEELATVNEEMANRNADLNRLNSDLVNLQSSTRLAVVLLGRDLTIRHFTPQAEKLFHLLAVDVGRPISRIRQDFVIADAGGPGGAPLSLESIAAEVITSMREHESEVRDKTGRWYVLRVRPYLTLDNKIDGAVLVLVDIDALKRSEQSSIHALAYADAIVRTTRDPLLILNSDLRVHTANDAFYSTFKMTAAEVTGRAIYDLGNGQWDIPSLRTLLEEILPRNTFFDNFEVTHDFPVIGRRTMVLNARTLVDSRTNQPARILLGIQDITKLQRASEALIENDRRKDEFLAMLAHELRGPLAPLSNMLEIMQRAQGDPALIDQARAAMQRQLAQMTRLINDLLDASRITQNRLDLRLGQVELASVVHDAVEECSPAIDAAKQVLSVTLPSSPVYLHGDAVRLTQVFSNLLGNACKFTEAEGHIAITGERKDDAVVISVKDDGIGIPPDMLHGIFDMFTQLDRSLERARAGLGIGLTLVRQLVEMHGGSVQAYSEGLGRGSEFVVRLPLATSQVAQAAPEPQPTLALARRVLVVDDNRDAAVSLATLLNMAGHETCIAHDGLEALDAAASFRPDVMLLDIGLPKLNGYEVARRLREQPWGNDITLIALTGWGQDEDRRKTREAGFDSHLVKPVDHAALTPLLTGQRPSAR